MPKKVTANKPAKTWDLTINNYTEQMIENLKTWEDDVTRMVVAKEVGERTGTPHLQMKVTFKVAKRFTQLQKLVGKVHIEESIIDLDFLYCKKLDSDIVININNKKQGKRSDLDDAIEAMKDGATITDLCRTHTAVMVKYGAGIERVAKRLKTSEFIRYYGPDRWPQISNWTKVHVVQGAAGIGKTQWALGHFSNPLMVSHIDDLLQFDAETHDGIIFDDLSVAHQPRNCQVHIADMEAPRSIHCRYVAAHIPAMTKKIFTCNPGYCPFANPEDPAIARRVLFHELAVTVTEVGKGNTCFAPETLVTNPKIFEIPELDGEWD